MSFDLTLKKTATSWRPGTAYVDFGEDYENFFTWLCAVPQGEVSGTYTRDGQTREVHGRGYHDHQWATGQMLSFWNRWLWGRQQGDGYTIERPGQEPIQVEGPLHYELSSQYRTFIM